MSKDGSGNGGTSKSQMIANSRERSLIETVNRQRALNIEKAEKIAKLKTAVRRYLYLIDDRMEKNQTLSIPEQHTYTSLLREAMRELEEI